ncbi:hypothetical protein NDU88_005243 [Pleurodeles waltl]|uniref:Uncharacterized protein n=1 Tax=Pleurodeles waltl TaxID=8319 RepID=A0AAV7N595_PLEWA|nr:hypothetical protein NDU88_005243 [Pleurodeles waltl]
MFVQKTRKRNAQTPGILNMAFAQQIFSAVSGVAEASDDFTERRLPDRFLKLNFQLLTPQARPEAERVCL